MRVELLDSKIVIDGQRYDSILDVLMHEDLILHEKPNLELSRSLWDLDFICLENESKIEIEIYGIFRQSKVRLLSVEKFAGDYLVISNQVIVFSSAACSILHKISKLQMFSH
jgi:hypothetical protein